MSFLNGKERGELFKQAHRLKPIILIGQNGLSEGILQAVDQALDSHELIKVKFNDFKEEKSAIITPMAEAVRAEVIRVVGHVVVLYRQNPDPEKRSYIQETLKEEWK